MFNDWCFYMKIRGIQRECYGQTHTCTEKKARWRQRQRPKGCCPRPRDTRKGQGGTPSLHLLGQCPREPDPGGIPIHTSALQNCGTMHSTSLKSSIYDNFFYSSSKKLIEAINVAFWKAKKWFKISVCWDVTWNDPGKHKDKYHERYGVTQH